MIVFAIPSNQARAPWEFEMGGGGAGRTKRRRHLEGRQVHGIENPLAAGTKVKSCPRD